MVQLHLPVPDKHWRVAQLVVRLAVNQVAVGSSPTMPANHEYESTCTLVTLVYVVKPEVVALENRMQVSNVTPVTSQVYNGCGGGPVKLQRLLDNIFLIRFKSQYEVTSTFMRLQEFYESPYSNIVGKYFTVEEYMDTYAGDQGNFTYFEDWSGFNVPGKVVLDFIKIYEKRPLLEKERGLLSLIISGILPTVDEGKFYIIAAYRDGDISHEVAHGLYYLNPKYKSEMDHLIDLSSLTFTRAYETILEMGYNSKVVLDEIQAYLSTSSLQALKRMFRNRALLTAPDVEPFREVYRKYGLSL